MNFSTVAVSWSSEVRLSHFLGKVKVWSSEVWYAPLTKASTAVLRDASDLVFSHFFRAVKEVLVIIAMLATCAAGERVRDASVRDVSPCTLVLTAARMETRPWMVRAALHEE